LVQHGSFRARLWCLIKNLQSPYFFSAGFALVAAVMAQVFEDFSEILSSDVPPPGMSVRDL
jgi:hypothetical protein